MSPRHCDSPLVLSHKVFKVERKTYANKVRIPRNCSKVESGWLGKRDHPNPNSFDEDLLNLYSQGDGDFEKLRDSTRPKQKKSRVKGLNVGPRSRSPFLGIRSNSPRISNLDAELSSFLQSEPESRTGEDPMKGRHTRASTEDTLEPGMPSGSGSSRLTSPTGRTGSQKEPSISSPDTPKSGWKRKRQDGEMNSPRSKNKSVKSSSKKLCDPDEIIEVDDTETPPPNPLRALRSATVLTDHSKLCEFPVGTKDSVSVCLNDYKTLEHDTFLNDIIIDFYLTYLFHKFLNEEDRPTVHIFSTMFYKRLNSTPKKASTVASYEKDSSLKPAEKRHLRVKGWTKNVNLFEKNMVIIPICEHSHWYLVIAIRPGLITIPVGSEDRVKKGEPFMIVLDSMGGNKTAAVSNIRHYLAAEWKAKMCADEEEFEFSSKEMRTVRPSKPEQENYTDCGIYLLHYIEKMFTSVAQYYWPGQIQDLTAWFTTQEVSTKRDEIARLIRDLSKDQNPDKEMKFPNIPFLPTAPPTRSKSRRREYEHESSESEEDDDWGGENSAGIAAAGFYGERAGPGTRNLSKASSSTSGVTSGESDVSSHTTSEIAREQRHRNRELRSKEQVKGVGRRAASAKSVNDSASVNASRDALKDKLKQINDANSAFDRVRQYKIPKTLKPKEISEALEKADSVERKVRRPSGESVIVVDNTPASSQLRSFTTNVIPKERSPEKRSRASEPARNSIVNSMQIKSRADLHEMNCVADLKEIEADMHEEEESSNAVRRKIKSAALKAFHADQKAIHESIVNEVSRIADPNVESKKQFSKSLPVPVIKKTKVKASPEKRKVLQSKVLEDLKELEEEGNTEDDDEELEVTDEVNVLKIQDESEPEIKIKKVRIPKVKEASISKSMDAFKSIVKEKVKINRDGKELSKMTPEFNESRQVENIHDMGEEYIESPSPDLATVEDTPEITTVEDTPESSVITTVEDETPDTSEVMAIDDAAPDEVVAIDDDFPLVGFLEKVESPASPSRQSGSVIESELTRKSTSRPNDVVRKSTSEPESPKFKIQGSLEIIDAGKEPNSGPDSPHQRKTLPKVLPAQSKVHPRGLPRGPPKLKAKSCNAIPSNHCSDPVTHIVYQKANGLQCKSLTEALAPNISPVKSKPASSSPIIDLEVISTLEQRTVVDLATKSRSSSPVRAKSTSEPRSPGHSEAKSTSEPRSPSIPAPKSPSETRSSSPSVTKSTSEPRSPIISKRKSTSEPLSPILSRKKSNASVRMKTKKTRAVKKITVDSDSEDAGNSSGSEESFKVSVEGTRRARPQREKKFSNLTEIERAKLKNIPTHERRAILAGAKQTHEVQITKPSDRNKLSKENPFYESYTTSRGAKSTQQQRGRQTSSNISDIDGQFHSESGRREVPIQIDCNPAIKDPTKKKKFRLQNHGKLSPTTTKPQDSTLSKNTSTFLSKFAEERFVSDSGSDTTDIYNTEEL